MTKIQTGKNAKMTVAIETIHEEAPLAQSPSKLVKINIFKATLIGNAPCQVRYHNHLISNFIMIFSGMQNADLVQGCHFNYSTF